MAILVIAEHDNAALQSPTRAAIGAAIQIGSDVHLLVAGHNCDSVIKEAAAVLGVAKVLVCDDAAFAYTLAENMAPLIAGIAKNYTHVLAPATTTGKDYLPRAAALLDMGQISDITQVISPDTFIHPVYAGNALETVQFKDGVKFLTVRITAFDKVGIGGNAAIEKISAPAKSPLSEFVKLEATKSARPELTAARIVISGGRGLGSKENFKLLESLADKLGAAIGASRAAVDAGYVPNDYQVGQTGKVVAPELYIAIGISGAIQHLAGMKDSKVIVAINKDENAPIFELADYGLVGDLFTLLPELEKALG